MSDHSIKIIDPTTKKIDVGAPTQMGMGGGMISLDASTTILACGGCRYINVCTNNCEKLTNGGAWTPVAPMPYAVAIADFAMCTLNAEAYVFGGWDSSWTYGWRIAGKFEHFKAISIFLKTIQISSAAFR